MHDDCKHVISASVYGVREEGKFFAFGGTCFVKRYGSYDALGPAKVNLVSGRKYVPLTPEQLATLERNLAELLIQFEDEWHRLRQQEMAANALLLEQENKAKEREFKEAQRIEQVRAELARIRHERIQESRKLGRQSTEPDSPPSATFKVSPRWFHDVNTGKLIFCYVLKDGSKWVLYASLEGKLTLRPWPDTFNGWEYKLQPSMGSVDLENGCYILKMHTAGFDVSRFQSCEHPVMIAHTFTALAKLF